MPRKSFWIFFSYFLIPGGTYDCREGSKKVLLCSLFPSHAEMENHIDYNYNPLDEEGDQEGISELEYNKPLHLMEGNPVRIEDEKRLKQKDSEKKLDVNSNSNRSLLNGTDQESIGEPEYNDPFYSIYRSPVRIEDERRLNQKYSEEKLRDVNSNRNFLNETDEDIIGEPEYFDPPYLMKEIEDEKRLNQKYSEEELQDVNSNRSLLNETDENSIGEPEYYDSFYSIGRSPVSIKDERRLKQKDSEKKLRDLKSNSNGILLNETDQESIGEPEYNNVTTLKIVRSKNKDEDSKKSLREVVIKTIDPKHGDEKCNYGQCEEICRTIYAAVPKHMAQCLGENCFCVEKKDLYPQVIKDSMKYHTLFGIQQTYE